MLDTKTFMSTMTIKTTKEKKSKNENVLAIKLSFIYYFIFVVGNRGVHSMRARELLILCALLLIISSYSDQRDRQKAI